MTLFSLNLIWQGVGFGNRHENSDKRKLTLHHDKTQEVENVGKSGPGVVMNSASWLVCFGTVFF